MKTKLSLKVRLRVEVDTMNKAESKIRKCLIVGKVVKVLFRLAETIGRLCHVIGLNR